MCAPYHRGTDGHIRLTASCAASRVNNAASLREHSHHISQRRRLIVLLADRNRVSVGRSTITIEAAAAGESRSGAAPHLSLNNAATHRPPLYQPFSWQRQARDVAAKLKQMGINAWTLTPDGSTDLMFSSACFQIRLKAQNI